MQTDAQMPRSCSRPGTYVTKVTPDPDGFVCLSSPAPDSGFTANFIQLIGVAPSGWAWAVGAGSGGHGCSPLDLRVGLPVPAPGQLAEVTGGARGVPWWRSTHWCHAPHPRVTSQLSLLCRPPSLWALPPRHAFPESEAHFVKLSSIKTHLIFLP